MCLPGLTIEQARERARSLTETAAREAAPATAGMNDAVDPALETADAWAERWFLAREAKGLTSVRTDRGRWGKWIAPAIGKRPMREVTRRELEQLVQSLDDAVIAAKLSWKTAGESWALVAKAFRESARSKRIDLRVREDNPAEGVEGPDRGVRRGLEWLRPRELLAVLECDSVPIRWKRLFALAVYTACRAGELEALAVEDVDLQGRTILIHHGIDRARDSALKSTKTRVSRRIPIEPTLYPLIEMLVREASGPRLLEMPPECDLSDRLRKYLQWAGVTRAELFITDRTRKRLRFHDLRATGLTWWAVRGDSPLAIQSRAGHAAYSMTEKYVRAAEVAGDVGEVFPALPEDIVSSAVSSEGPAIWGQLGGTMKQNKGVPSGIRNRPSTSRDVGSRRFPAVFEGQALGSTRPEPSETVRQRTPTKPGDETNPRIGLAEDLARRLVEALRVGDLGAARVAHRALSDLIAPAPEPIEVADLNAHRRGPHDEARVAVARRGRRGAGGRLRRP